MGGGAGIRTPGTLSSTSVFKTDAINRSATPPFFNCQTRSFALAGAKVEEFLKPTRFSPLFFQKSEK
jgi:hypothetical protein